MKPLLRVEIIPTTARRVPGDGAAAARCYVSSRRAAAAASARALIENAAAEADSIRQAAVDEIETLRASAIDEGRAAGERAWAAAAHELASTRVRMLASLERDCVRLALEIARQVLGRTIAVDGSAANAIAARTCAALRRDGLLAVRISPCDETRIEALRSVLASGGPVVVEIDQTLSPGDCIAECAGVRVDGRLDTLLATIEERLLQMPRTEVAR